MHRRLQAYKRVHISTASPAELVVMLYDGMIKQVTVCRRAIPDERFIDAGRASDKALAIIGHLREVLRPDVAPQLAASLDRTYATWSTTLIRALAQRDADTLEALEGQMQSLRDAWLVAQRGRQSQAVGA